MFLVAEFFDEDCSRRWAWADRSAAAALLAAAEWAYCSPVLCLVAGTCALIAAVAVTPVMRAC